VQLIDLDKAITGEESFFRDYVHFTPEGHQEVAKLIATEILKENN
jgi:lysophospholipase L1-like esterase